MDLVIGINNDTTFTPEVTGVTLRNAQWVPTQAISVGQSLANHTRLAGMLEGTVPFDGSVRLRYYWSGRESADVTLTFQGRDFDGTPAVGYGLDIVPPTALTGSDVAVTKDDNGALFLLLTVQQ
jgi:hypothetical protein